MKKHKFGTDAEYFPARLKSLRLEFNESQTDLAYALGVSRTAITNWESGLRVPTVDMFAQIARHYSVSADYLWGSGNDRNNEGIKAMAIQKMNEFMTEMER